MDGVWKKRKCAAFLRVASHMGFCFFSTPKCFFQTARLVHLVLSACIVWLFQFRNGHKKDQSFSTSMHCLGSFFFLDCNSKLGNSGQRTYTNKKQKGN